MDGQKHEKDTLREIVSARPSRLREFPLTLLHLHHRINRNDTQADNDSV